MRNVQNKKSRYQGGNRLRSAPTLLENYRLLRAQRRRNEERGFTRVELVVVLGALGLLAALSLPLLANNRAQSDRVVCQSNLRQIGHAYAMWSDDHGGKYPQLVGTSEGGNNDSSLCNNVWFQFIFLRAELGTPRILICPSDSEKHPAFDWSNSPATGFNSPFQRNKSCSYVLSLGVLQSPHGLLSGDRNMIPTTANAGACPAGPLYGGTPALDYQSPTLDWTEKLHNKSGNIVLNDGSVIAAGQSELRTAVQRALPSGSRFLCVLFPN